MCLEVSIIPDIYIGLQEIKECIGTDKYESSLVKNFTNFTAISIDYAIMEKAEHIFIISGNFGWDDVGSWLALERIKKSNEYGNVVSGNVITVESKNCIIEGTKKLIATVGISDLVIVDTEDATLVCQKNATNEIKKIIENLKIIVDETP